MAHLPAGAADSALWPWFGSILDTLNDPLTVFDEEGQCLFANQAFLGLCGEPAEQSETWRWLQLQRQAPDLAHEGWLSLSLDDGRQFEVLCRPLPMAPKVSQWVFHEVTQQKQLEAGMAQQQAQLVALLEELSVARDKAHRASEAKGQFLANISHELRTPLHGIIGMSRLAMDFLSPGRGRDYLDKAMVSAKNLLRIVNDVLDFSKIESGHMSAEQQPFPLDDVLNQAMAVVEVQAQEKGLSLRREIISPLLRGNPHIQGDSLRLQQVLVNLLGNAIKFTEAGHVRLLVGLEKDPSGQDTISFSIVDTGIGLTPAQQQHIFDEFAQGDGSITRKYGGTGLGLAISRRLCQLMGGNLEVDSTPGQGSTFRFRLPLVWAAQTAEPQPAISQPPVNASLAGCRVLVVEDHPINQEMTLALLHNWGAQVDLANNGLEALRILESHGHNPYHAILLDLQMPDMDGFELAQHLRMMEHYQQAQIIAISAYGGEDIQQRCETLGIHTRLLKPFEPLALLAALSPLAPNHATEPAAAPPALLIPGIDTVGGLRRAGGQQALYQRLLGRFVDEYREVPQALDKLLSDGQWTQLERRAHTLKGLAATLGASALSQAAEKLQDMAATQQPQPVNQALASLKQALAPILVSIEQALEPTGPASRQDFSAGS